MPLITESYLTQIERWPKTGRHILAQYDSNTVIVYQAYKPSIGRFAAAQGYFGGQDYSLGRMSWIKPNFLWMMYRSGWGIKEGQEMTLAIWLKRAAFDSMLAQAVHSTFTAALYASPERWKTEVAQSSVRLQWDPDHNPSGGKLERRALQLGLRGEVLRQFAQGGWIAHIEDISAFVEEQRKHARSPYTELVTPQEWVYPVGDEQVKYQLQLT